MFLSSSEIAELTGISRGRNGESREQLQAKQLRAMGVAFRVNAKGRPVITWDAVNGLQTKAEPVASWKSNVLKFG